MQNHGTEKNEKQGLKDKKPAAKNWPLERPSLINHNHSSKFYGESGSENDNTEEIKREKNMKNTKEITPLESVAMTVESGLNNRKLKNPRMIMKYQEIKKKIKSSCHQGNDSFQPGKEHFGR